MLKQGDKIGLVCCSDGLSQWEAEKIDKLEKILCTLGVSVVKSPVLYQKESIFSGTETERAGALMELYKDQSVCAIFDVSGGNAANGILEYLDYEVIKNSGKTFFGYSDLTTVLNSIYAMTGKESGLYQIRNLSGSSSEDIENLCRFEYSFLRGSSMTGVVVGGNIRCFLKLAGTPFWPDIQGKILFLESNGGEVGPIATLITQLRQIGVFKQVSGILLGTFTAMEKGGFTPTVEDMILEAAGETVPVAKTYNIGHGRDSKCLMIGKTLCL